MTDLDRVAGILRSARHVVVFTGAGVSAESGIPTFRDALTGVWARFDPEQLATPAAFARNPTLVWSWYRERREKLANVSPNPGHFAIARLESLVPKSTLVTQNVDGLHRRAGSSRPIELHGNLLRARCSREGTALETWTETDPGPPPCPRCGAPLRPDVVWFGEMLPAEALRLSHEAAVSCDLFLSVGTSNLVEPAASLPWTAADAGATVVIVNVTDEGQHSGERVVHLLGRSGVVLPALLALAWPDGTASRGASPSRSSSFRRRS